MEKNTENLARIKSAATLARLAEEDLKDAVTRAVLDGASWTEIGTALDISKQTAHNRYAKDAAFVERLESGEHHMTQDDAEQFVSATYNPHRRVKINIDRDYNYRRNMIQDTPEPSKIVDEDRAGASVTPSIFSDAPAPATQPKKRRTEKEVLDSYAAKRARKATMPDLCPGCGKRWHGQEHWDGRPTAFTDCTETQNDHEWTGDWPARANHPYPKTQEQ